MVNDSSYYGEVGYEDDDNFYTFVSVGSNPEGATWHLSRHVLVSILGGYLG